MNRLTKDTASGLNYVAAGTTENPKHVLVLLHGSGGDYSDMEAAAPFFAEQLPDTLILVPDAPYRYTDLLPPDQVEQMKASLPEGQDIEKMRSWFGAVKTGTPPSAEMGDDLQTDMDDDDMGMAVAVKVQETVHTLHDFIDAQLKKYKLADNDLAIYGFSQGGVLALATGVDRYEPAGAIVSHSGYVVDPVYPLSRPQTLLIVESQELAEGQPMQEVHEMTRETLRDLNVPVTEFVAPGLGHNLNQRVVDVATKFIRSELGIPEPAPAAAAAAPKPPATPKPSAF